VARKVFKGEKRYVRALVKRRDGEDFALGTATFEVYAPAVAAAIDTGSAMVEEHEVFFLLDTTASKYVSGNTYRAYMEVRVVNEPKVLRNQQMVEIVP